MAWFFAELSDILRKPEFHAAGSASASVSLSNMQRSAESNSDVALTYSHAISPPPPAPAPARTVLDDSPSRLRSITVHPSTIQMVHVRGPAATGPTILEDANILVQDNDRAKDAASTATGCFSNCTRQLYEAMFPKADFASAIQQVQTMQTSYQTLLDGKSGTGFRCAKSFLPDTPETLSCDGRFAQVS